MSDAIRHGVDGWQLVDYSWSEENGNGIYRYERTLPDDEKKIEHETVIRLQPAASNHEGWAAFVSGQLL